MTNLIRYFFWVIPAFVLFIAAVKWHEFDSLPSLAPQLQVCVCEDSQDQNDLESLAIEPNNQSLAIESQPLKTRKTKNVPHSNVGKGALTENTINSLSKEALLYNVVEDLQLYSGLSKKEVTLRLARQGHHHFVKEHEFWNPESQSALAWYYRTSVSYLFANAIHKDVTESLGLTSNDGEVLDYSGGVGNNVLGLAMKGIKVAYFGIGLQEYEFTRFRFQSKGLEHMIRFIPPFAKDADSKLRFDPINAIPKDGFRTILLFDVLEHIPNYHITLRHLIDCLASGGIIYENTPFGSSNDPMAIHQKPSVPMAKAMVGMKLVGKKGGANVWKKL